MTERRTVTQRNMESKVVGGVYDTTTCVECLVGGA